MSWNPNDNDPWGRKNSPPDLDDAIKQLRKMFASGGSGGDSGGTSFKFDFKFFSYLITVSYTHLTLPTRLMV